MHDDKVCLAQSRIVEDRFEQKRIAAALTIETAGAFDAVDVDGHAQTPRFARDVIEKKILERFVARGRRLAASDIASVDEASFRCIGIVEVELA